MGGLLEMIVSVRIVGQAAVLTARVGDMLVTLRLDPPEIRLLAGQLTDADLELKRRFPSTDTEMKARRRQEMAMGLAPTEMIPEPTVRRRARREEWK